MIRKRILNAWIVGGLLSISNIVFADTWEPSSQKALESAEIVAIYENVSGMSVSATSIRKSLSIENAAGKEVIEISTALQLIATKTVDGDGLGPSIAQCLKSNPNAQSIEVHSVGALLAVSRDSGLELGRKIVLDPVASLEKKLLVSRYLIIMADDSSGYRILREGLLSTKAYERVLARSLFMLLGRLDGQESQLDGHERIDLKMLLEKLRSESTDNVIVAELDSLKTSYIEANKAEKR